MDFEILKIAISIAPPKLNNYKSNKTSIRYNTESKDEKNQRISKYIKTYSTFIGWNTHHC